ncbi:MAG: hypothetical protein N3B13_03725 [Deltaproteobacteria bacterium]|nr:hypothetical protein [Deltaproteobacteria bacterium]
MHRVRVFIIILFTLNLYGSEKVEDIKKFLRSKLSLTRLYVKTICKDGIVRDLDDYLFGSKVNDEFIRCMEERLKDREMKDCKIIKIKIDKIINKFEESHLRDVIATLDISTGKDVKINEKKINYDNIDYYLFKKSLLYGLNTSKGNEYYYEPVCFKECVGKAIDKIYILSRDISEEKICNDYRVDITLIEGHDFGRIKVYSK